MWGLRTLEQKKCNGKTENFSKYKLQLTGFPDGSLPMQETWVQSVGQKGPLEKEIILSILGWEIPWTEEPTVHRVAKSWTQLND